MALPVTSSTDLLQVGKGIVVFKPLGDATFYDVGNVPEIELTPEIEELEHFSSREGTRTNDKTIVLESTSTLRMVMEEASARNLAMLLLADIDNSDPEFPVVQIGSRSAITGELRFYGTNDVGPKWIVVFPRVDFLPSGSLNLISEEWNQMEVEGRVALQNGMFGTMTPRNTTAQPPENIAEPVISGANTAGDVLTASTGTWLNSPTSYTYSWLRDGVAISPAQTNATYTLTNDDVTHDITVTVTATNANGADAATSAAREIVEY